MRDVVEQLFASVKDKPKIAYETEEDQVVAGLVAQGFGIAIVPYMELLHKLDVSIIQISSHSYSRDLYMVSNEQIYMPPAVKNFYEFVLDKYKKHEN